VPHPAPGADLILAPNGAAFRRAPRGILPELLDQLMPERATAIARGDRVASQAIKILMNSFYGVLGTSACRFYQPAIAGAITAFGRELLLFCKSTVEEWGLEVLYGDTDSLFIASGHRDPAVARELAESLPPRLDAALADYLASRWRVQSRLHVERDRLFRRLHLPPSREGGGARKRYAGLVEKRDGTTETVLVGLEAVRRDWTGIARDTQRELYRRLFADEPLDQWLASTVEALRRGDVPQDQLLYRKRLTKGLDDYTAAAPPHVVAARLAGTLDGWTVTYAITVDGPQPLGHITAPLDLEHYVQRQIRPIAEPILAELGLVFDRVVGDDRQLALF
jgi:DNA polymerase-2